MHFFLSPYICIQTCSVSDQPLEGANARLEELKESLYQKEREITELLEAERIPVPPVQQPHCSVLLPTVITKVLATHFAEQLPSGYFSHYLKYVFQS